jgi:glycosyltransferase involved in cell wall biosynthesis
MNRLKILAIAFACDPMKGSEFAVGWGWASAIAARHDLTVITADFNAASINDHLISRKSTSHGSLRFEYVKNRPWHYRPQGIWLGIEESPAKPLMNFAYQDWLRCAFAEARKEVAENHYDIIHLITYVGWRFPGKFYQLGVPFVWGPIGGLKNTPWRLLPILGPKGAIYYGFRNLINSLQIKTLPGPKRALQAANNGVIAATSEIQDELWNQFHVKSQVICEVGPPDSVDINPKLRGEDETLKICWSGLHLPGKALHLLLRAAALLPKDVDFSLEILGEGPCNRTWRSMAHRLKIADRCHWHGWLSRNESLAVMKNAHAFVITSLKDLTSTVAVEAICLGLPVISLDHCGFADLVTDNCGIKIPPGSSKQIVRDLSLAICRIYQDEDLRRRLARGAVIRSYDYSWESKLDSLNHVYAVSSGHTVNLPRGKQQNMQSAEIRVGHELARKPRRQNEGMNS